MTDALVLDVSVALKWVLEEQYSDDAHALLRDAIAARRSVVAPPLFPAEATNAIHQRQRRGDITAAEADAALETLLAFPVQLRSPADLYPHAMGIARQYKLRAAYDSQYLAVALSLDAEFWTADERLYNALPRSLRWIHWVGDYSP